MLTKENTAPSIARAPVRNEGRTPAFKRKSGIHPVRRLVIARAEHPQNLDALHWVLALAHCLHHIFVRFAHLFRQAITALVLAERRRGAEDGKAISHSEVAIVRADLDDVQREALGWVLFFHRRGVRGLRGLCFGRRSGHLVGLFVEEVCAVGRAVGQGSKKSRRLTTPPRPGIVGVGPAGLGIVGVGAAGRGSSAMQRGSYARVCVCL